MQDGVERTYVETISPETELLLNNHGPGILKGLLVGVTVLCLSDSFICPAHTNSTRKVGRKRVMGKRVYFVTTVSVGKKSESAEFWET